MPNTVDANGSKTFEGYSIDTKGNHSGMPPRNNSYLPTDERGHIEASSLGGSNKSDNVVAMARSLNNGSYNKMEQGERDALKHGAIIYSEKTAFASNQPGHRPDAFIVNDQITYKSGNVESIHLSFANQTNAEQEGMNREAMEQASDLLDAQPNPGDKLRDSMSVKEYSELMEKTDAELPNIRESYKETGRSVKVAEIRSDMMTAAKSNSTGIKNAANAGKTNSASVNLTTGKVSGGITSGGISAGKGGISSSGKSGNGGHGNGGAGGGRGSGVGGGISGGGHNGNGGGHNGH